MIMPQESSPFKIKSALIIALMAISSAAIFVRLLPGIHAVAIAFWRMTFASIVLWGYIVYKQAPLLKGKNLYLTALAGLFLGFHFAFFFTAVQKTSLANATLFGTLAPVFTTVIEWLFFNKSLQKSLVQGLIIGLIGTLVIQIPGFSLALDSLGGDLSAVISSFWMALVILITAEIRKGIETMTYSVHLFSFASLTLLFIAILFRIPLLEINSHETFLLVLLGLIPNLLGHSMLYYTIRYLSPSTVASIPLGEPLVVSTFGWILFGEAVHPLVFVGGSLILFGLWLIIRVPQAHLTQ